MGNCADSFDDKSSSNSKGINTVVNNRGRKSKQLGDYLLRYLLIGDSNVGKSALLLRYSENTFTENFMSTIGVDFKIMQMELDNQSVRVQVWDTAGQERFRTITSSYYRGAQGVIVVYDVTNRESFRNVNKWMEEIQKYAMDNVALILVGNKCDDEEHRKVSTEDGKALAERYRMAFFETSAKSGSNVQELFVSTSRSILVKVKSNELY